MRTEERAYYDDADQQYLFARSMAPYVALADSGQCRGTRVLDAGCGAGSGSALLAEAGAVVHAVDFSHADVVLTERQSSRVRAVTADVYRLPYTDDSFDLVISCHVLEHLDAPDRYLAEIERVLAPKGKLWLITPNRVFSSPNGPPQNPFHVKEYFYEELAELLSGSFREVEYRGVVHAERGSVARADQARSSLHALDRLGLRRFAPAGIKRAFRKLTGATYPAELEDVSVRDFAIREMDPRDAIDLVAITCGEAESGSRSKESNSRRTPRRAPSYSATR